MKYLKSFNESNNFLTYTEFMEQIKEVLLPISDLGYDIGVEMTKNYVYIRRNLIKTTRKDTNRIYVRVVRYNEPPLKWNKEIEEEFDRLKEFSLENRFKLSKVYYIVQETDGRVFDRTISYDHFIDVINQDDREIVNLLFELEQITR